MSTRSFLLSFLSVQATRPQFGQVYPGAWLVWEPGAWKAPSRENPLQTQLGSLAPKTRATGDALCFALGPTADSKVIRVGRDPAKNEIVINDATVSREALLLCCDGSRWLAQPALNRLVGLMGMALAATQWTPLSSGYTLEVGDVRLTFYDGADSLRQRLPR